MRHASLGRPVMALVAAVLLLAVSAASALAHPPPTHLHCLTTASGDIHSIARGVTLHGNHETAFHNLHSLVHQGAFASHPLGSLAADLTAPYSCPPSP